MAKFRVLALCFTGLVCAQALETGISSFFEESTVRKLLALFFMKKDPRCEENGIFAVPDCTSYFECRNGYGLERKCPNDFRFDSVKYCTPDDDADCGITVVQQSAIEQSNDLEDFNCKRSGRFANPRRCDSYIECYLHPVMNETLLYMCPPGLHYNTEIEDCDDPCDAQCDQDLACKCGWPHCGIACDESEGLSPVATNCRLYVSCRNNRPTVLKCPENMGFDSVAKQCMDIEEANCVMPSNDILSIMRNW